MAITVDYYVDKAYEALSEAKKLADETGVSFSFNPAYGMGGRYHPKKISKSDALEMLRSGDVLSVETRKNIAKALDEDDDDYYSETGWVSSSNNC